MLISIVRRNIILRWKKKRLLIVTTNFSDSSERDHIMSAKIITQLEFCLIRTAAAL